MVPEKGSAGSKSVVVIYFLDIDLRVDQKKDGRQDKDDTGRDVHWTIASILHAASPPEDRIALEILVVLPESTSLRVMVVAALARMNR